jgi:TetR/AcrR family transcriptional regulator
MLPDPQFKKGIRTRDPAATRERILMAGVRLFSQRGYDEVTVDAIVRLAGVNKRMVYHYFGNKEGLYQTVLSRVFERLNRVEADLLAEDGTVSATIERIIRAYFAFLDANPEFVSLLLWENLQGGRHLRFSSEGFTKAPMLKTLDELIVRGLRSGEIRQGIDRRHMLISLIGLCQIYFSNRHTLSRSVGLDLKDRQVLEEGVDHAIALAKCGFLASPG